MLRRIHVNTSYSCKIKKSLNFPDRFLKNPQISYFNLNPSSGNRDVACGRTDRRTDIHDEDSSFFSQFCQCSLKMDLQEVGWETIHPYMGLQPLPGLCLPHKTPPFIPIFSSSSPSSYPQQLQRIPLDHIRPPGSWSSHRSCGVEVCV